jgi:phosphoribosylaminoimidazole-succinocarboxamide synthase
MKKAYKQLRKILRDKGVDITDTKFKVVKHGERKVEVKDAKGDTFTDTQDIVQFVLDPECGRAIYKSMKRKVANA